MWCEVVKLYQYVFLDLWGGQGVELYYQIRKEPQGGKEVMIMIKYVGTHVVKDNLELEVKINKMGDIDLL